MPVQQNTCTRLRVLLVPTDRGNIDNNNNNNNNNNSNKHAYAGATA
jgi:hypothetical protein